MNGTYPNVGDFGGGWNLINEDLSMAKRNTGVEPKCFNANSKTFGSFAGTVLSFISVFVAAFRGLINRVNPKIAAKQALNEGCDEQDRHYHVSWMHFVCPLHAIKHTTVGGYHRSTYNAIVAWIPWS